MSSISDNRMESDLSSDDEVTTIGAGDSDVEQINSTEVSC